MENPEEVLLVLLQEFQKLRPSEIPRELEDYLCWVARTGDPVFQWSLIKALFREKLMRVMTDFYENCPTLDLTPCPNVDQFNYDIMKSNLLDRLESFANAPFTVQRICELLTTPRKEYNRIDKFMRAIEKNLLVVSTREPGPYGRRSENGDSMVNGSVEDETSHHGQTSNEVEMENWVKDCTVTTDVPMHSGNDDDMSVENGLNSPKKSAFGKHEKIEHLLSAVDTTASSFTPSSADFSVATAAATVTTQESPTEPTAVVQNLTTVNHEAATIVGDVSDVIMNEDTSSQPSLDLESDDNDSSDSKKLQTSFQAKDFTLDEEKEVKTYSEVLKGLKPEEDIKSIERSKESDDLIQTSYSNDKVPNENTSHLQSTDKIDSLGVDSVETEADTVDTKLETETELVEKSESEPNICVDNFPLVNNNLDEKKDDAENVIADLSEALIETKQEVDVKDEKETEPVAEESIPDTIDSSAISTEDSSEKIGTEPLSEVSKPIIEEPSLETTDSSPILKTEITNVTIEGTVQDDINVTKTVVPDPIPVVEEPKEVEPVTKEWEDLALVSQVESEVKETPSSADNALVKVQLKSDAVEDNQMVVTGCEEEQISKGTSESMDVDNEALISAQQDEPMEQETTEAMNS